MSVTIETLLVTDGGADYVKAWEEIEQAMAQRHGDDWRKTLGYNDKPAQHDKLVSASQDQLANWLTYFMRAILDDAIARTRL